VIFCEFIGFFEAAKMQTLKALIKGNLKSSLLNLSLESVQSLKKVGLDSFRH